jgi:hypothetical protein
LRDYEHNNFAIYLKKLFGEKITGELVSRYFIGSSKLWNGATVFWQIDTKGVVRTGKIMLYSPSTGKRVKEPINHISWAHTAVKQPQFALKQCLFGEHLLNEKDENGKIIPVKNRKPVAIVESEKTAVIASIYLPKFTWLAVGSLTNLNAEKCTILKGRTVTLFPDLNGYEKWNLKALNLSHITTFTVSDLLERKSTEDERSQGLDLADYLIQYDYKDFTFHVPEPILECEKAQSLPYLYSTEKLEHICHFTCPEKQKRENWEQDISELENYFAGIVIPAHPVKLNRSITITNCSQFIKSHLETLKENNGKHSFMPFLHRLQELKLMTIQ